MQARFGDESLWVYNILRGIDHSEGKPLISPERNGAKLSSERADSDEINVGFQEHQTCCQYPRTGAALDRSLGWRIERQAKRRSRDKSRIMAKDTGSRSSNWYVQDRMYELMKRNRSRKI